VKIFWVIVFFLPPSNFLVFFSVFGIYSVKFIYPGKIITALHRMHSILRPPFFLVYFSIFSLEILNKIKTIL